jgi:hypothetical protein
MDLRERLDLSIGPAPRGGPDPDALVAAGRRVVRRRRLGVAGAGLAAVLAVGGATAVATQGERAPEPVAVAVDRAGPVRTDALALIDATTWVDGQWRAPEGAAVLRIIDDPYLIPAPGGSVALELRWRGRVWWIATWRQPGHDGSATGLPEQTTESFEDWTVQQKGTVPPRQWPVHLTVRPGPDA